MQTVRTNTTINASTQYTNHNYTSMCMFNGVVIGAGPSGLFKACCGNNDNGNPIEAYFIPGTVDFGDSHNKRLRRIYVNGRIEDQLNITITGNGYITQGPYTNIPETSETMREYKFSAERNEGYKWQYADFKFANIDGGNFAIDSALAIFTLHHRRRR